VQVSVLTNNSNYGLVHGPCVVIDEFGNKSNEIIGRPGGPLVKHSDVKLCMIGNWTLMMPTPLVSGDVIKKIGFFNEEIPPSLEDVEFWVRCSFYTSFFYMDEPMVYYRKHANNISSDKKKYIDLPLYLERTVDEALAKNLINKKQRKLLTNNLVRMQLKGISYGIKKTIGNLFKLDSFWLLKFRNVKLLIKMISR
jgi:hypothetical protein